MGTIYTIKKKIGARHRTSVDEKKIAMRRHMIFCRYCRYCGCYYYRMTTVVTIVATRHGIMSPQLTFCITLPYALRHTSYLTLLLTRNGGGANDTADV